MPDYRQKLKDLLYELFQFDSADLDFGFYAVMNQKRERIARFIEHDLLDAIHKGLQHIAQQSAVEAQQEFEQARQTLQQQIPDLLQGDDIPAEALENSYIANSTAVQAYQAAQANRDAAVIAEDMEAQIYNDLYNFFARYYQDGDFISQRRYGRSDKYAIPYNGQEVHLHWANYDQYYVKSGVHFNNYSFAVPGGAGLEKGASVQVRLSKVDMPRDNLKGDKRFFIHAEDQTVAWDEERQTLVIPMEYRPLTEKEAEGLSGRKLQEALLELAHAAILEAIPNTALRARLLQADPQKRVEQGRLAYHLRRYAAANTRDFFVHKDLGAFLGREFDYYLKAEVLHLEDINFDDLLHARRAAARLRTTRAIGQKIIAFLDQLEGFQRRLFLKRKFILQSDYCLTLDKLPAARQGEFYAEILANQRQLAEWKDLYGLPITPQTDLNLHPRLMLDTAFFGAAFKARLLACFDDLDTATDGLLVHGENFQALNLLLPRYRGRVKCVHIDPPYNTQTSGFLYKNSYQHSSWLAMMNNRIRVSTLMLLSDGAYLCHIDENEYERLYLLFERHSIPDGGTIVWDKKNPMLGRKGVATQHEYVLWRTWINSPIYLRPKNVRKIIAKAESLVRQYNSVNSDVRREFVAWIRHCEELTGGERAYSLIDHDGRVFQSVAMGAPEPRQDPKFHIPLVHPITKKKCPVPSNGWSRSPKTLQSLVKKGEVIFGKDEMIQPRRKVYLTKESKRQLSSIIRDARRGKTDVIKMGLEFPYCHPVSLYEELLGASIPDEDDMVLDFFAGSGTTAHAVMQLNREEGGNRKYILVEMADYFDTVLKPRIQKVAYSDKWKDGRPVLPENGQIQLFDTTGQSHMFQYVRLESYDDVFHNIRFRAKSGPQLNFLEQLPDYFLSYKLEHETGGSPGLLDLEQFQRPFEYQLLVTGSDGVLEPQTVDLVATFNFLIGLAVHTTRHYEYQGQPYARVCGAMPDGQRVCVLWRNVLPIAQLDAERDWALAHVLHDVAYDRLYVNGENTLPGALLIEDEFKRRMFQGAR